ncbi:hypothetical protein K491DRAFT_695410 [Lophiostoma macrostomum CBS 122681]|uniref:Uncharacterized protein n=1 Tax=Lophiostoma macrostomum CBS 122681 TaxID=1314788 RepID=A0A6A6SYG4_9PLEO|nr:hypothetical protein K491DRAFT_695410 [Lophiostoma macrostomum CBS 122681]
MQLTESTVPPGTPIYIYLLAPPVPPSDLTFATSHWPSDAARVPDDANDVALKAAAMSLRTPDAVSMVNRYLRAKKFGDVSGSNVKISSTSTSAPASTSKPISKPRSPSTLPPSNFPTSHSVDPKNPPSTRTPKILSDSTRLIHIILPHAPHWPPSVPYADLASLGRYEYERRRRGEAPLWSDRQVPVWVVKRRPDDALRFPRDAVTMRVDGTVYRLRDVMGEDWDGEEDGEEDSDEDGDDWHWMAR